MQTLDDAIMDLLNKAMISPEEAYSRSIDKNKFRGFLKNPPEEWQ
jgi:twitching motility protein PilT